MDVICFYLLQTYNLQVFVCMALACKMVCDRVRVPSFDGWQIVLEPFIDRSASLTDKHNIITPPAFNCIDQIGCLTVDGVKWVLSALDSVFCFIWNIWHLFGWASNKNLCLACTYKSPMFVSILNAVIGAWGKIDCIPSQRCSIFILSCTICWMLGRPLWYVRVNGTRLKSVFFILYCNSCSLSTESIFFGLFSTSLFLYPLFLRCFLISFLSFQ